MNGINVLDMCGMYFTTYIINSWYICILGRILITNYYKKIVKSICGPLTAAKAGCLRLYAQKDFEFVNFTQRQLYL